MRVFGVLFWGELARIGGGPRMYLLAGAFALAAGVLAFPPAPALHGLAADPIGFLERLPWLLAGLAALTAAPLWVTERRLGLLRASFADPTPLWLRAGAKLAAAWAASALALLTLAPLWLAAAMAGPLDWGALLAAHLGAILLLGVFCAIGAAASALAPDELLAAGFGAAASYVLTALALAPEAFAPLGAHWASWSPVARFLEAASGVVSVLALLEAFATMGLMVGLTALALEAERAQG